MVVRTERREVIRMALKFSISNLKPPKRAISEIGLSSIRMMLRSLPQRTFQSLRVRMKTA